MSNEMSSVWCKFNVNSFSVITRALTLGVTIFTLALKSMGKNRKIPTPRLCGKILATAIPCPHLQGNPTTQIRYDLMLILQ